MSLSGIMSHGGPPLCTACWRIQAVHLQLVPVLFLLSNSIWATEFDNWILFEFKIFWNVDSVCGTKVFCGCVHFYYVVLLYINMGQQWLRRWSSGSIHRSPSCMLKYPWARWWTPNFSEWVSQHLSWKFLPSVCECAYEWVNVTTVVMLL